MSRLPNFYQVWQDRSPVFSRAQPFLGFLSAISDVVWFNLYIRLNMGYRNSHVGIFVLGADLCTKNTELRKWIYHIWRVLTERMGTRQHQH